ncbi:MAG: FdhF/YdeP family oxidoreductase [Pseudopedobacter sp.]|nr:FdhF/YdeP family oxidoreductase [Deinococcales bacterium]
MDWKTFNPLTWTPEHWAGPVPFGLGEQRPNNYLEMTRAMWESRDNLEYAWKVLNEGVCDGCALGTSGLKDFTLKGPHLCNIRLRLLRLNTVGQMDTELLWDVVRLEGKSSAELRELGRLPYPMLRKRGQSGFRRVSWNAAQTLMAEKIRSSAPERLGFFLTSRGMPNEGYYGVQKAVRAMGTNSIDNAARVCHAPSTVALKETVGVAATTCSYTDWLESDLIVFIGSNVATNQPVATKYLHYAKKAGAKVVCINPYLEPGMERYWVPSLPESALFGTKIADEFFQVNIGGDSAFLNGALKHLLEHNLEDKVFIQDHTEGFAELKDHLQVLEWADLERASGCSRAEMGRFGQQLGEAKKAVLVWSMGITQHTCGEDNVRTIVNLALAKGFVGRGGCGLMPIRGHSGVQGGGEMGAYTTALPGGKPLTEENIAALEQEYGFPLPRAKGLNAVEMLDAAYEGKLDFLFSAGGNFLEVMPEPRYVRQALERVTLRVHMDLVITPQMLLEGHGDVLLLPAQTRYEMEGGVTETSTERRILFSPHIPGHRIGEAQPEYQVLADLACQVKPELEGKLKFRGTPAMREEIARVVPFYDGIQKLEKKGDQIQYGGRHLCVDGQFPTVSGRGRFSVVQPFDSALPAGEFRVTTRRGKQFNSMVHEKKDAITGASRDSVMMSESDAQAQGLQNGDRVQLESAKGKLAGRVFIAPLKPGNLEVHWPEGNVLLDYGRRSSESGVPDYNATVRLEKLV